MFSICSIYYALCILRNFICQEILGFRTHRAGDFEGAAVMTMVPPSPFLCPGESRRRARDGDFKNYYDSRWKADRFMLRSRRVYNRVPAIAGATKLAARPDMVEQGCWAP